MNEKGGQSRNILFFTICILLILLLHNITTLKTLLVIAFLTLLYHYGAFAAIAFSLSEKHAYGLNNAFAIIRCVLIMILSNKIDITKIITTDLILLLICFFIGLATAYYSETKRANQKYTSKYSQEISKGNLKKYKINKEKTIEELKTSYENLMLILTQSDRKILNKIVSKNVINDIELYFKNNSKEKLKTPNEISEIKIINISLTEEKLIIEINAIERIYDDYYERNNILEPKVAKRIIFSKDLKNKNKITEWFIENMSEK